MKGVARLGPGARPVIAIAVAIGVAIALGAVFAAYQRPDLAVDLATRIWNCF